jgi:3-oxoadipate enol-lactonase
MRLSIPLSVLVGTTILVSCGENDANSPEPAQALIVPPAGFVEVPGGRLYYETTGAGDPIVFIHGNAGDRRHWDRQFHALADRFRVIRYDVRGYGQSSRPMEGTAYSDYEDLAVLLDHLRVRSAHIAGWSMGSGIAIDFALAHPGRTKSLISIGPWISGYSSAAAKAMFADMAKVRAAFVEGGQPAAVHAWMAAPFFAATIRDPAAGEEFRRIAADYSFSNAGDRQPLNPPAVSRIREIRVPTLVLTAEHDIPACLEVADLLDRSIPDSTKIVMGGTGHMLHMERPEEFNKQLTDFLLRVGG